MGGNSWFNMYVDGGVAMAVTTTITNGRYANVAADIMMAFVPRGPQRSVDSGSSSRRYRLLTISHHYNPSGDGTRILLGNGRVVLRIRHGTRMFVGIAI